MRKENSVLFLLLSKLVRFAVCEEHVKIRRWNQWHKNAKPNPLAFFCSLFFLHTSYTFISAKL